MRRFHDIRIAAATVQSHLRKHGLGKLPANQKHQPHGKRWKRYEKPMPGHRLQMDVMFFERIPGTKKRLYQFTAIDDCTRIRVLKIYDACNQATAVDFVDEVLRRLPFRVQVVQTDNEPNAEIRIVPEHERVAAKAPLGVAQVLDQLRVAAKGTVALGVVSWPW